MTLLLHSTTEGKRDLRSQGIAKQLQKDDLLSIEDTTTDLRFRKVRKKSEPRFKKRSTFEFNFTSNLTASRIKLGVYEASPEY